MAGGFTAEIKADGLQAVRLKAIVAKENLLLSQRRMVGAILEEAKPTVIANTPLGPAHFGDHGRDTVKAVVEVRGTRVTGKLVGAVQLKWREFGTRGRRHVRGPAQRAQAVGLMTGSMGMGEPPFMTAHKAVSGFKRVVNFYYGGLAKWWNSPPA